VGNFNYLITVLTISLFSIVIVIFIGRKYGDWMALKFDTLNFRVVYFITVFSVLIVLLLTMIGYLDSFESDIKDDIEEKFTLTHESTKEALEGWYDYRKELTEEFASNLKLTTAVIGLISAKTNQFTKDEAEISKSIVLFFKERPSATISNRSYYIIDKEGHHLFNESPALINQLSHFKAYRAELFTRVLSGETLFIPPVWSEIDIDDNFSKVDKDPAILIATPIRDTVGEVVAIFALRFDPSGEYSRIFRDARLGTFDSYAIDNKGYFVSESRFTTK
jgi:polar amino acid transport system substrate-binding protein